MTAWHYGKRLLGFGATLLLAYHVYWMAAHTHMPWWLQSVDWLELALALYGTYKLLDGG